VVRVHRAPQPVRLRDRQRVLRPRRRAHQTTKDEAPDTLDAWLVRLTHRKTELRAFLDTESMDDLDDV